MRWTVALFICAAGLFVLARAFAPERGITAYPLDGVRPLSVHHFGLSQREASAHFQACLDADGRAAMVGSNVNGFAASCVWRRK